MTIQTRRRRYAEEGSARDNCGRAVPMTNHSRSQVYRVVCSESLKPANVWADHNRRTIRTERLQATAMGLAWVLAGMLAMTLLLAIARYAIARAADAATLAPSLMMF